MPSQKTKIPTRKTALAYSGIDVVMIEKTEIARSCGEPSFMPASTPEGERDQDHEDEGDAGEDAGVAEAIPENLVNGPLVDDGVAEIAGEYSADPFEIANDDGAVVAVLDDPGVELLGLRVGAENAAGDERRVALVDEEEQQRDDQQDEDHHPDPPHDQLDHGGLQPLAKTPPGGCAPRPPQRKTWHGGLATPVPCPGQSSSHTSWNW